ncbi:hypothetical protein Ahy_A04g017841 isoform A [Arachis hypogaea]|uniref:Uncharacterized protein n=1 Tax=Arachis hypogaea TaxID=3818 RepID=A0A445DCA6_ARAHY|nr:hypothetical protein Ahy_A04g017841 isoform A [Arachis hypogaea]
MTTILNPMMADHELKFERLARQVERIARIVDYDEGESHNARRNNEGFENVFQNENNVFNRKNPHIVLRGQNADEVELMKNEKDKHRNEQKLKSKLFTRKEKVAYVTIESLEEELDFKTEIDLAKLKQLPGNEKSNESKLKSKKKKYSFAISKSDQIFDVLLTDKQLIMSEGRTLLSVKDLKEKPYCKFHQGLNLGSNNGGTPEI